MTPPDRNADEEVANEETHSSDFDEKYNKAVLELNRTSINKKHYLSRRPKLLRKLGLRRRPPFYYSLLHNVIFSGVYMFIAYSLLISLASWFGWYRGDSSITELIPMSAFVGIFYGIFMGFYYRYLSRDHPLTKWEEL